MKNLNEKEEKPSTVKKRSSDVQIKFVRGPICYDLSKLLVGNGNGKLIVVCN